MKMSYILIFLSVLQISAGVFSQETMISLDTDKRYTVKELFQTIEDQTSYRFFYNAELADLNKTVSITQNNLRANDLLDFILDKTMVSYRVLDDNMIIVAPKTILQQGITVTGTVNDGNGETLPGVNISVKGSNIGVVSDANGNYSINVPNQETVLLFSFVGYTSQEILVGDRNNISVVLLETSQQIDEVVVVGYGTQKKLAVTGSVVSASGASIAKSSSVDVASSLAGRMPGVIVNNRTGEPGKESTTIFIRGRSTLEKSGLDTNAPLIIIDGVPGRESLSFLNPNDIETITVLKDASAAIYGNRSANGVILVTTKRGRQAEKATITFSYDLGIQQPTRLLKMSDAPTYATLYNEMNEKIGGGPQYRDDEIELFRNGSNPIEYPNTDWFDAIIKPASSQHKFNLAFSGGTNVAAYFVSLGGVTQDGIYRESATKYDQLNLRSNLDVKVTQNFKIGVDVSARIQNSNFSSISSDNYGIFYITRDRRPTTPVYYPGGLLAGSNNPLALVSDRPGYDKTRMQRLNTTLSGDWNLSKFVQGLSLKGHIAFDNTSSFKKVWKTPYEYYAFMPATATDPYYFEKRTSTDPPTPQLMERYIPDRSLTLNATINYERSLAGVHNIGAMVGVERSTYHLDRLEAEVKQYSQDALDELFAGDKDPTYFGIDGKASESARLGYFGRLSYDYKSKYLIQFLARYDGSENFPKNKRWGFFPGVSAGWRLSEEDFIKENLSFVNNLKIKGSYGEQGNDRIVAFQYLTLYRYGRPQVFGGTPVSGIYPDVFPNPNVTWEVAKTWNFGLELTLWDGKLGLEAEAFKTRRSNILTQRSASVPYYTGLTGSLPDENIGIVDNKGFEFQLSHAGTIGEIRYNVGGNFLFARNKVIFTDETPWGEGYDYLKAEGRSMGSRLLYEVIGINKTDEDLQKYPQLTGARLGDFIFKRNDPTPANPNAISVNDRIRADLTTIPEIVFGLNFDARWRMFDFSMLLQGQARAKYYLTPRIAPNEGNIMKDIADGRWSKANPASDKPGVGGTINNAGTTASDYWHRNASFLRLKNLEIGMNLPKNWLASDVTRIENLRIYMGGYNLLTFDKLKIIDPESNSTEQQTYPQLRILNMGVKLTF